MPSPYQNFATIADWENFINQNIIPNGNEEIDGVDGNVSLNGAVKFIIQSTINWNTAKIHSVGGNLVLNNGVTVVMTNTPTQLSWGDNFYNEWYLVNMTPNIINLSSGYVYYDPTGSPQTAIPANSIFHIAKTENGLWVQVGGGLSNGGGNQKQPQTYIVGVDPNAPIAGTNTWQLGIFANSYMILFINGIVADLKDAGTGSPYITKPLNSDTVIVSNMVWNNNDVLTYNLVTP